MEKRVFRAVRNVFCIINRQRCFDLCQIKTLKVGRRDNATSLRTGPNVG